MRSGSPRDYVGYGETFPTRRWPNGSHVAVSLVLNIEDGAERRTVDGDAVDDTRPAWTVHQVPPGQRNLTLESAFDYGARAGIWRLLRTLREFDARATAFCCARALEVNPAIAAALVRDGHEIANHGLGWHTHTDLDEAAERDRIRRSTHLLERVTGQRPRCWYSRDGISRSTRQTMLDEGYGYDSNSFADDVPYSVPVGDSMLTVVPYAGDTNDSGLVSVFATGGAFGQYLCDSLEMLISDSRGISAVLSVGLHPRLIGRPAWTGGLRTFLRHARARGAWIATRAEIVAHWETGSARLGQQPPPTARPLLDPGE